MPITLPTAALTLHGPHAEAACQAMAACIALCRAGCRLRSAHCHDDVPVITVDRRPPIRHLRPQLLSRDAHWSDFNAPIMGVMVAWSEPRRRSELRGRAA